MDTNKILKSDYLDIVFEGRNKSYGGYELRRNYPKRVKRSLMALGGIALLVAGYGVYANMPEKIEKTKPILKEVTLSEPPPIDPKKPPPPPPPAEPPPPVKPTVKFTPPVIAKDEEVREDEKPPEQAELKEASAGVKTEAGDINGIDPGIVDKPGTGTGVVEAAPPPPAIFTYVEQMPEPPFDVNGYLSDNLRYPDAAREAGIEGRVVVKFVVNEDGDISDAQVVRGVNGDLDAEALRVIRKMPKWKPGKQNGRPVKVYYTVPVSYRLE
jgi:protein TonB